MEYALLIYENPQAYDGLSDDERRAIVDEYWALRGDSRVVAGAGLKPVDTATTVRVDARQTLVTDGPFADTKEVFGGYFIVASEDIDGAIAIATRCPAARLGGSVEIRPIVEPRL
jgi:hypothetical protein